MCAAVAAARKAERIEGILNQALVQIVIKGNKLHVYPQRGTDTLIYYVSPENRRGGNHAPAKPWETRWVVDGLKEGQRIVIAPKAPGEDVLESEYVIVWPDNSVRSGEPTRSPGGKPLELHWKYNIFLYQDTKLLDQLDPEVVVKDDP